MSDKERASKAIKQSLEYASSASEDESNWRPAKGSRASKFSDEDDLGVVNYGHGNIVPTEMIIKSRNKVLEHELPESKLTIGNVKPYEAKSSYDSSWVASSGVGMNWTLNLDMSQFYPKEETKLEPSKNLLSDILATH